jgi:hypothetical protein
LGQELVSKRPHEDHDHPELEEGEVVGGLPVAAGGDPSQRLQPSVGALDRPALACLRIARLSPSFLAPPDLVALLPRRDRFAAPPRLADPGADPQLGERLLVRGRGVAAIGPELERADTDRGQLLEQRQQVAPLVLVAGPELDRKRQPAGVDG